MAEDARDVFTSLNKIMLGRLRYCLELCYIVKE